MIKYLIAFMLFSSPCLAGMGIGGFPYPGPGVMADGSGGESTTPDFVQAKSIYSKNSITLDSPASSGNALIAILMSYSSQTITEQSVSMSGGCASSWTSFTEMSSNSYNTKMYLCTNALSGQNAVTPSGTWTTGDASWYLIEASNIDSYDVQSQNNDTASSNTFSSGSVIPTTASSFAVGAFHSNFNNISSWDAGWTQRSSQTIHYSAIATQILSSASGITASGSATGANRHSGAIFIFKGK